MILTSARRMADMIADLMDLTRFRLGAGVLVDRAPADLGDICQSVVLELRALHPSAVILYERVGELRGSWDGSRLAQVAANLIGNALEHGAPGAPIQITAAGLPAHASLRVHNAGATIPPARRAAIFEPMVRYTRPGMPAGGGIGLGLFIVRSIVLAHGGTVEMTSSDRDGTAFEVVLPRN
jgi:sigma-B regulation protein RsbU (phosphoserine phosphatase)